MTTSPPAWLDSREPAPDAAFSAFVYPAPLVSPEQFARAASAGTSFVFAPPDGPALAAAGIAWFAHTPSPDRFSCRAASVPPHVRAFCAFPFPDPRASHRAIDRGLTLLPRWQYCAEHGRATATLLVPRAEADRARALAEWKQIQARLERPAGEQDLLPPIVSRSSPTEAFRQNVGSALRSFAGGELEKVVLSRRTELTLAAEFDPLSLLEKLNAEAGWGCRIAVQHDGAAFVAATPERLIRLTGLRLETEALAGTADLACSDGTLLRASEKDAGEHALVVRDLASRLRPITSRLHVPDAPGTRALRHVVHLMTPIAGELIAAQHVLDLAALLFPTPAVCGLPRDAALAWIQRHEEAPRGLYAGLVGWFDSRGDGDFWVALRGATVSGRVVEQRVGAGLVPGSDPDGELAETEAKQRGLLRVLGGKS